MKNLYNEVYSLLPIEEKKEILENLAKKYNMELLRFETFSKYSKSTFTAVFKYKESEFVFVPGDTVTLGYEGLPKNLSDETLKGLKYCLDETEDLDTVLGEYIRDNFSKLRKATIKPMLVERELQTVAWKKANLEEFKEYLKTRQCAFPDADGEKTCEEKGEPTEYLSGHYNAYNYVPISVSHKRDFEAQNFPIDDIQSYFDNENKLLLRAFGKLRLKEILNVPNDMYIPPNVLTNWAIRNDVVHFVPMQYRQLI